MNRDLGKRHIKLVDRLPGVLDTWLLRRIRGIKDPASLVVVLSALNALEHLLANGDARTPRSSYLQAFFDLVRCRDSELDSHTEIYTVIGSEVLDIAPGVTFGYVHPDFRPSEVSSDDSDDQVRLNEFMRRWLLENGSYGDLLEEFDMRQLGKFWQPRALKAKCLGLDLDGRSPVGGR